MAYLKEKNLKPYEPKKDVWDEVLDEYGRDLKNRKTNVFSFRVTDAEKRLLDEQYGGASGVRAAVLKNAVEEIEIRENGDLVEVD